MIKFVCECFKFKIMGSQVALKKVFHLIWRKDNSITDMIVAAGHEALFSINE